MTPLILREDWGELLYNERPLGQRQEGSLVTVPKVLRVPIEAFSADDIAVQSPWGPRASASAEETLREMETRGFDAAPVYEEPICTYVTRADLRGARECVGDVARPMTADLIISENLRLIDVTESLKRTPQIFVLYGRRGIDGIITRADLQRPPVALLVLSLLLTAEASLRDIVSQRIGNWRSLLGEGRLTKAEERLQQRLRNNTELELVDCLTFDDRLQLLRKCPELVTSLGFASTSSFRRWEEKVKGLRNDLAHAGNLLEAEPDSLEAIKLIDDVIHFAVQVCRLAESHQSHTETAVASLE